MDDGNGGYGGYVLAVTQWTGASSMAIKYFVYDESDALVKTFWVGAAANSWLNEIAPLENGNFVVTWRSTHQTEVFNTQTYT